MPAWKVPLMIRPFVRSDREQVTSLVNAHIAAVVPGASVSVQALMTQLQRWGVARRYADGALPAPGVYGVPEQWPHIRAIYERIGFQPGGRTEVVYLARIDQLARPEAPLTIRRTVGINGTRITAMLGPQREDVGFIEVDTNLDAGPRVSRLGAWADIGNLWVE